MMQHLAGKQACNVKCILTALLVALGSLILLAHHVTPGSFTTLSIHIPTLKESKAGFSKSETQVPGSIPNIVHFVHLVNSSQDPVFDFPFRQFVAIYSAWHYLRPDTIYIHTNVKEYLIDETLESAENPYAQAVSKIPSVKFNYQKSPNQTTLGRVIEKLPHQSDFVRTEVLGKFGGIYLDDDAYVLRDLKTLRYAGFENVVGRQSNDQICNAVILSTVGNKMMKAYRALQDGIFDGSWGRHSTELLTALAREFQVPDHHLLIVPQDTFFPSAWLQDDLQMIYRVHKELGARPINNKSPQNLTDFIENFELGGPATWRRDWRSSYVLHGWTSGIQMNMDEKARDELFGEYGAITPAYVLARNSNFARAVYPAVKSAIDNDFMKGVKYDQA